ncbi:MAG: hypothetical protein OHK006_17700 [Thermodesulfovibrionales bacterium]
MNTPEVLEQMTFPFPEDCRSVASLLSGLTGRTIDLVVTDNSTVMLSARQKDGVLMVRMHRILLSANREVFAEVACFLRGRKTPTPLLRAFIRQNRFRISQKPPRRVQHRPEGRHHDLREIFERLNQEYFDGRVRASITWGQQARGQTGLITMGSFQDRTRLIRINPALDQSSVPRYFVAYVVYHEMLHADLGVREQNGRRVIHPPEFRRREKLFREYQRASDWERKTGR